MYLVGEKSTGLVQNFNFQIFSDSINGIKVKLCMVVLYTELYLLSDLDIISRSQQCQTALTENSMFYPIKLKLCVVPENNGLLPVRKRRYFFFSFLLLITRVETPAL